jgi:hypothetical protein
VTLDNILIFAILGVSLVLFISEKLRVDLVALMVLVVLTLTGLISPADAFSGFASPAEYVNRALRWGDAGVDDYLKFPERALEPSDSPFEFSYNLDEDHVRTQFEAASDIDNFDMFLAKNRTQAVIIAIRHGMDR